MRLCLPALTLALGVQAWAGGKIAGPSEIPSVTVGVPVSPLAHSAQPAPSHPLATPTLGLPASLPAVQPVGFARLIATALVAKVQALAGVGESVPAWPGKAGEKVRLGKASWTLARVAGEGGGSTVWDADHRDYVVKILHPEFAELPHYGEEAALLRAISDIPHARLVAASKDGRVMVKERLEGDALSTLFERGFEDRHRHGWAELAAKLIRGGVTADLVGSNVVWSRWRSHWALFDAGGIIPAGPEKVLRQMLAPQSRAAGLDGVEFLRALRGRLGPDSDAWIKTDAVLRAAPEFAVEFAALQESDSARSAAPQLEFRVGREPAPFPDAVMKPQAIVKALGYDPYKIRPRWVLHGDDPGKLNTIVFRVEPPGKPKAVVKETSWDIVRNEVALRRVVRRFFSRWFDVPSAYAANNGLESYLVMEHKEGSGSYGRNLLTREQRVALAILANAFGLWDVNPGNVLFTYRARPVLIDFEQALGRRQPAPSRVPDERIALEMPWMSRHELNCIEDYQPAIRAWRRLLREPATRDALREDFVASGFTAEQAERLLRLVDANTADLDWALQVDAEFVNQFVGPNR